jgi:hypothetical protein
VILNSFLSHALAIQAAAAATGGALEASVHLGTFNLVLRHGENEQRWVPRFMIAQGGRLAYATSSGPSTVGFAGWLPYSLHRWREAADKAAFKAFAEPRGVALPASCRDPALIGGPFLVKGRTGSFGEGQRGPFLSHDSTDPEQQLAPDEYYENFIVGHIAKAWYWGAACLALELQAPATVTGNGRSSLRELVQEVAGQNPVVHWDTIERLARYCGIEDSSRVVPAGQEVLIEYRYGARFADPSRSASNRLEAVRGCGLAGQFEAAGQALQGCIPQPLAPSLYTLDAIVDGNGRAVFLEMNCNPLVHPHAYAAMLASAFGLPTPVEAAGTPAAWEEITAV